MLILFSTSKTMNFEKNQLSEFDFKKHDFKNKVMLLVNYFKKMETGELEKVMKISPFLAEETKEKFLNFSEKENPLKPALSAFTGEVFKGLNAGSMDKKDIETAEAGLRILSGLYGILTPLTMVVPYRLEMGYKIDINGFRKVSAFWKEDVTNSLNKDLLKRKEKTIINLASKEYTDAVDRKNIKGEIIDVVFKDNKNGKLKTIPIYSKKARGKMAEYIIKKNINDKNELKKFSKDSYKYDSSLSKPDSFVFIR